MALLLTAPEHSSARLWESSAQPHREIARLALLHDEARETARLANLLGRAPYGAAAPAIGALATVVLAHDAMPIAAQAAWVLLVAIGVGAMARTYARALRRPFERGALREFAYGLNASAIYTGFAWGTGAFLALGSHVSEIALVLFAAGLPALLAVTLRAREFSLGFLAPAAALGAFAAVLRPLPGGSLAAVFVLIACAAVGGAIFWMTRLPAAAPMGGRFARVSPG